MTAAFLSLDGIDGVGKSTQLDRLRQNLQRRGNPVLSVRDPGSTEIGLKLRSLLLDSDLRLHRRTEAMLFMASRCEMVETVIGPALASGRIVLSDRFLLANVVYQSVGGEVSPETLWRLGELANGGLRPGLTILLDMPAAAAMKRLDRPADRMESRGIEYLEAVRQAFLEELPRAADTIHVVDADRPPDQVAEEVITLTDAFLEAAQCSKPPNS